MFWLIYMQQIIEHYQKYRMRACCRNPWIIFWNNLHLYCATQWTCRREIHKNCCIGRKKQANSFVFRNSSKARELTKRAGERPTVRVLFQTSWPWHERILLSLRHRKTTILYTALTLQPLAYHKLNNDTRYCCCSTA